MTIVHLTLFHGRPRMSEAWLHYMKGKDVAACVTEGDQPNIDLLRGFGVPFIEFPNRPLGAKCNAGLAFARTFDPDAVMILPSDDFVSHAWTMAAMAEVAQGTDYVLPERCALHEPWTGRSMTFDQRRGVKACGSGRVFSRRVLDAVPELWTPGKMRGLDTDSHQRVLKARFRPHYLPFPKVPIVDVKSELGIWPYDHWRHIGTKATADEVLWMMEPETRARIAALTKK